MQPEIRKIKESKLVGKYLRMSFTNDRTFELWRSFMPYRKTITNISSTDMYSVLVYDSIPDFDNFNPSIQFDKWAAVPVDNQEHIPERMNVHNLSGGLYAVFLYIGLPSAATPTFTYIYTQWLPSSEYELDDREHFQVMGSKYSNTDPASEEELWIPIRLKNGR